MRGFILSIGTALIIGVVFLVMALLFSFFAGGTRSTGLFGWGEQPLLSGVEIFITQTYNYMVYISSWVAISVLLIVFLAVQGLFLYAYAWVGMKALHFRKDVQKIIDELLDI